ncbi:MAG: serine/threonine-protein kinase [Gemmatales bacterium]
MKTVVSQADFLRTLKKSGILKDEVLQQISRSAESLASDGNGLAARLQEKGLLTSFQCKQLLAGKYQGLLIGTYLILEPIGKGGQGRIYLGMHTSMQRRVAIKVLPADKAEHQEQLQRFYREARSAAALDHPNIVKLFDVIEKGGTHILVMEYVPGHTLQQLLTSQGPIPYPHAIQFAIQIATGLQHAHEKGFIHRDIKPNNIMLSKERVIKILDLGLTRSMHAEKDNLTKQMNPHALMNGVEYGSPEQLLGGKVDARSDLYSLGATLFALITGTPPFSKSSAQDVMDFQRGMMPVLARTRPDIPQDLNAIVAKLMAKDPQQRFQTASDVIAALTRSTQPVAVNQKSQAPHTAVQQPARTLEKVPTQNQEKEAVPNQPRLKIKNKPGGLAISSRSILAFVVVCLLSAVAIISLVLLTGRPTADTQVINYVAAPPAPPAPITNYVTKAPPVSVDSARCVCLDFKGVTNTISTQEIFSGTNSNSKLNDITLESWGRKTIHGVPFELIDPQNNRVRNVFIFGGGDMETSLNRSRQMSIPCNSAAKKIHVLGGIAGWAFPFKPQRSVAIVAKLYFKNGGVEEHQLLNGTHFADWCMPEGNVPTAPVVVQLDNKRHLHYFSLTPREHDVIEKMEFVKPDNGDEIAPIFFAITVERPVEVAGESNP